MSTINVTLNVKINGDVFSASANCCEADIASHFISHSFIEKLITSIIVGNDFAKARDFLSDKGVFCMELRPVMVQFGAIALYASRAWVSPQPVEMAIIGSKDLITISVSTKQVQDEQPAQKDAFLATACAFMPYAEDKTSMRHLAIVLSSVNGVDVNFTSADDARCVPSLARVFSVDGNKSVRLQILEELGGLANMLIYSISMGDVHANNFGEVEGGTIVPRVTYGKIGVGLGGTNVQSSPIVCRLNNVFLAGKHAIDSLDDETIFGASNSVMSYNTGKFNLDITWVDDAELDNLRVSSIVADFHPPMPANERPYAAERDLTDKELNEKYPWLRDIVVEVDGLNVVDFAMHGTDVWMPRIKFQVSGDMCKKETRAVLYESVSRALGSVVGVRSNGELGVNIRPHANVEVEPLYVTTAGCVNLVKRAIAVLTDPNYDGSDISLRNAYTSVRVTTVDSGFARITTPAVL